MGQNKIKNKQIKNFNSSLNLNNYGVGQNKYTAELKGHSFVFLLCINFH
jgi:hypothetical protein